MLMMVAEGDPRAVTRAFELEATDVIERPLTRRDLLERLRRVLPLLPSDARTVTGRLENIPLPVVLETLAAGFHDARVVVAGGNRTGMLDVEGGVVVRGRSLGAPAEGAGPAAVIKALTVSEGGFEVRLLRDGDRGDRAAASVPPAWNPPVAETAEAESPTVVAPRPRRP
jgi:hypothetical protein